MFQVSGLKKSFGQRLLFEDVTFTISQGQRIGLVGRNGSGKSTLLKVLMGVESSDSGEMSSSKNYQKGYLKQHISFKFKTVREEVASSLAEDQKYDVWRAEKILQGLGFDRDDQNRDPKSFSGGYQVRINLAKTLVEMPKLLILDEPTNYLDIISLRWLKNFLCSYRGEVILVTHDRDFMDSVVTHVMGIHRGKLKKYQGKTADYYEQLLVEEEIYEKTRVNQEKQRKQIERFVNKFRAKARQASLAQSRMKMLKKMDVSDKLSAQKDLALSFPFEECPAKFILNVKNLKFGYTADQILIDQLSFSMGRQDRIAIIGKNGKGKSTLMNLLSSHLAPISGEVTFHPKALKGYFGQTNIERLSFEQTVEQEIASVSKDISPQQARSIAGAMMFDGDDSQKKIKVLSGGEKSRVMMGKILAQKSNILLLDEPTNHLDQESVEGLIDGLHEFAGAVLLITHSEYLLRELANKLIIFHRNKVEFFEGSYDDFLRRVGWEEEENEDIKSCSPRLTKKELTRKRQELIQKKSKELKCPKKQIDELEQIIEELELRKSELERSLVSASQNNEGKKISELSIELGEIEPKIDQAFTDLEILMEKVEQIELLYQSKLADLTS